jgi:hypothetical protein
MLESQWIDEWLPMLRGELPADRMEALLTDAAAALDERVRASPHVTTRVGEIIARRLDGGITVETWGALNDHLNGYLGGDLTGLIWTVLLSEDVRREAERLASPEAVAFLQTITAIYGPDLEKVYVYSNENPDDWALVQRHYYLEMDRGPIVSFIIEKYNGEQMRIAGPPDSALNMASVMIEVATNIAVENFNPATLGHFKEMMGAMIQHLETSETEDLEGEEIEEWMDQLDEIDEPEVR